MDALYGSLWPQVKAYPVHECGLQSNLYELWKDELLCDVVLVSQDGRFIPAHSIILAAASGYFRALLTGAGRVMRKGSSEDEMGRQKLLVDDTPYELLHVLVGAIYENSVKVCGSTVADLLAVASYFQIQPILDAVCMYLRSNLSLSTCLDTLALTGQYACRELHEEVISFVCGRFTDLQSSPHASALCRLPLDALLEVLMHDELDVDSESEVMRVCTRWVQADLPERLDHLPQLLQAVRLEAVPTGAPKEVLDIVQRWQQSQSSSCSTTLGARQAMVGVQGPGASQQGLGEDSGYSHNPHSESSMMWVTHSYRPRTHGSSRLLVVGGCDSTWQALKQTEVYDPSKDEWSAGPLMPRSCTFAACAQVSREVFVIGGSTFVMGVSKFDARTHVWHNLDTCMGVPRMQAGVAGAAGCIYVMGGRTPLSSHQSQSVRSTAERFVVDSSTWQYVADMGVPRYAHGCAVTGGRVFVVGGQGEKSLLDSAEWYDPGTDCWREGRGKLLGRRKYTAACNLGGRVFLAGGINESRTRLSSVEWLDPREGRWQLAAPMLTPRSSCGLVPLRGVMYVVGGNTVSDGQDTCDCRVEAYHPAMDCWTACSPINIPRSGLCAAAI